MSKAIIFKNGVPYEGFLNYLFGIQTPSTIRAQQTHPSDTVFVEYSPRRSGRTTRLIELSAETGIPILCNNNEGVKCVLLQAERLKKKIKEPISLKEIMRLRHHPTNEKSMPQTTVLVDDAEVYAREYIKAVAPGLSICGMTLNDVSCYALDQQSRESEKEERKRVKGLVIEINKRRL